MSDSEEDQNIIIGEPDVPDNKRGRPPGKSDSTKRYRRTAQEISDDKIRIAQMKLDAVRVAEERKLANKKTRPSRSRAKVEESELPKAPKKVVFRDEYPPPSPPPLRRFGNSRQALYDSWFTR